MRRSTLFIVAAATVLAACSSATAPTAPAAATPSQGPVVAGQTGGTNITGPVYNQAVTVPSGYTTGLNLPARLFVPAGNGPFKAVVAMHGCGGLMLDSATVATEFVSYGKALADSGYVALFLDSFSPRGIYDGVCNDSTKINEAVARVQDAYSGLTYVKALSNVKGDSVAILGWSNGGSAAMSAIANTNNPVAWSSSFKFTQALIYYPGCGLRNQYGGYTAGSWKPYAPTRVMIGSLDSFTSGCQKRVTRGIALGGDVQITVYSGAQHGFNRAGQLSGTWAAEDYTARDAARVIVFDRLKN